MQEYKIEVLMVINGLVLAVYYSPAKCYQFSVIDEFNTVFDCDDVFYTSEAAERMGRAAVKELSW